MVNELFEGENFTIFSHFRGFCCYSYTCRPADIHTTYSQCAGVVKYTKPLDMLRYTSVSGPFKKCLAAITHEYVIAVERIWKN